MDIIKKILWVFVPIIFVLAFCVWRFDIGFHSITPEQLKYYLILCGIGLIVSLAFGKYIGLTGMIVAVLGIIRDVIVIISMKPFSMEAAHALLQEVGKCVVLFLVGYLFYRIGMNIDLSSPSDLDSAKGTKTSIFDREGNHVGTTVKHDE
jgi:hypothetical protein